LFTVPLPSFNGNYYELVDATRPSFNDALLASSQSSYFGAPGHLATITTLAEFNFVLAAFSGRLEHAWIGANDVTVEGTFRWVTGPEAGQNLNLPAGMWGSGQPDGGTVENCAAVWYAAFLNDADCRETRPYLIEYERKDRHAKYAFVFLFLLLALLHFLLYTQWN
jgi:hypothetical protein